MMMTQSFHQRLALTALTWLGYLMVQATSVVVIDPGPIAITTTYSDATFQWDVNPLSPWYTSGDGTSLLTFDGGSIKLLKQFTGTTVTSGVPFKMGRVTLTNPTSDDGGTTFTANLDIAMTFSFSAGAVLIDDLPVTFTETVNVAAIGCSSPPDCPDFIRFTVPRSSTVLTLTVPGTPSNTVYTYEVEILGMVAISYGGTDYDTNLIPFLAAGEPIVDEELGSQSGVGQAYIIARITGNSDQDPYEKGDPHFRTWNGESYDFHGECDLVFVHNPDFAHGLGLDIHTRTKIYRQWSYIDQIAIRIGDDNLEIHGGMEDNLHWINGEANIEFPHTLSGYQVTYHRANSKQREYQIKLDHDQSLIIKTFKDFVSINIHHGGSEDFGHSVGLTGLYGTGHRVGRDGTTIINDPLAFGQEWQVIPEVDGQLFRMVEGPQHPEQCKMPSAAQAQERRRRLGESKAKLHDAEMACEHIKNDEAMFDNCVFDVLLTDDIEMAGAY